MCIYILRIPALEDLRNGDARMSADDGAAIGACCVAGVCLCGCVCVGVCVCVCVCVYICMYMYVYIYMCMSLYRMYVQFVSFNIGE